MVNQLTDPPIIKIKRKHLKMKSLKKKETDKFEISKNSGSPLALHQLRTISAENMLRNNLDTSSPGLLSPAIIGKIRSQHNSKLLLHLSDEDVQAFKLVDMKDNNEDFIRNRHRNSSTRKSFRLSNENTEIVCTNREVTKDEEINLKKALYKNFLFKDFNDEFM